MATPSNTSSNVVLNFSCIVFFLGKGFFLANSNHTTSTCHYSQVVPK